MGWERKKGQIKTKHSFITWVGVLEGQVPITSFHRQVGLNNRKFFLTVLETGNLRLGC